MGSTSKEYLNKLDFVKSFSILQQFLVNMKYFLSLLLPFVLTSSSAQTLLLGSVKDSKTNEEIIGATILIHSTLNGVTTDIKGNFKLVLKEENKLPLTLDVKSIGYEKQTVIVKDLTKKVIIKLAPLKVDLTGVDVVGERIREKQKLNPLTVEQMDLAAIKETPAANFYDGLGQMKGVDITAASIGFKVINTRGFNSTSPVRSLQVIDGVDNQAPGLNFSLGNFLGASEIDVKSVDLVMGASSAYFGPNAFNGVISMNSKDPFTFTGLSVLEKVGERNLNETAIRYAQKFKNKKGDDLFAYKFNIYYMKAHDWEALNYNATENSKVGKDNPGGYDAVNRYGDEYVGALQNFSDKRGQRDAPGLGVFYRTGYLEKDLVDYNSQNLKLGASFHYRFNPKLELIYSSNFGYGTTVYQGENRLSLKDITFYQNRVELKKENKWFVQAYATNENSGKSFDAVFTANLIQSLSSNFENWALTYYAYWATYVIPKVKALPGFPAEPVWPNPYDYDGANAAINANRDLIQQWHKDAAAKANTGSPLLRTSNYYEPGTPAFDSLFKLITTRNFSTNKESYGSRFYDRSALYHLRGEYKFTPKFCDINTGGNVRIYAPVSKGTVFIDTGTRVIHNYEFGLFAGLEKKIIDEKLKINATARLDKNQNFNYNVSPALSAVFAHDKNNVFRVSMSSAIRNPTLLDQYFNYNVGPAILKGNVDGFTYLCTIPSLLKSLDNQDTTILVHFDVAPIQPEKVKTVEVGYRGTLFNRVYVDASYYYSFYHDFIGYKLGADAKFDNTSRPIAVQVYRVAANAKDKVTTQGFAMNYNYYFAKYFTFAGNYSWNRLNQIKESDSIIPAYNTPENKFNISISARDLEGKLFNKINITGWGFNINYKWVQGFIFEGSPQFTGFVPAYDMVDAQINYHYQKWKTTFKLGASNLFNKKFFQVYGGPYIARLAYFSILIDLKKQ